MGNRLLDWLQILANVGLIAGLVMVGIQLDQNSDLLRAQILGEESRRAVDQEWLFVGDHAARVWARALEAPTELTVEEARIMDSYLWSVVENWVHSYRLAREGIGDTGWRQRMNSEASYFLGNPYGRGWWRNYSEGNATIPREVIDHIDQVIAADPDATRQYYIDTRAAVGREVEAIP